MLLALLGVVLLLVGLLWGLQRKLIYLTASGPMPSALTAVGPTAREVTLSTEDGLSLGGWLVGPTGPDRGVHVLVAPGNAGNRGDRAELALRLAAVGFTVLLFDYRGYGGNPGDPSETGLLRDARAAWSFLVTHAGARPERLLYLGESLGSAVLTALATERPPAGLVLRSPFTSLAAIGQRAYPFLPVRAMLRDRYPVLEQIARVRVPTVVVYGGSDRVVPPTESESVAAAAAGPVVTVRVPGADHNDPALVFGPRLVTAVLRLADRLR